MSRAASIAILTAALALGAMLGAAAAISATQPDDAATGPVPLVQVEIINVRDPGFGLTPHTLVELEDGRRRILREWYGEPGDTFMLPAPVR